VVDDGSRDGTAALAKSRGGLVRLVSTLGNRGKGYSVRNGILAAQGSWILSTDADLSAPIQEVEKLIAAAPPRECGGGDRFARTGPQAGEGPSAADARAFRPRVQSGDARRDWIALPRTQCGFKLFRKDAAQDIFSRQLEEGFSFDVEDLLIAQVRGLRAVEVPRGMEQRRRHQGELAQGMKSFADLMRIRGRALQGKYK